MLAYSQEIYDWIKTFHVLGAIVWVGGGVFVQIYATRLIRAKILMEPTDFEYGERQYAAADPAGHRWTFYRTLDDTDPKAWVERSSVGHHDRTREAPHEGSPRGRFRRRPVLGEARAQGPAAEPIAIVWQSYRDGPFVDERVGLGSKGVRVPSPTMSSAYLRRRTSTARDLT